MCPYDDLLRPKMKESQEGPEEAAGRAVGAPLPSRIDQDWMWNFRGLKASPQGRGPVALRKELYTRTHTRTHMLLAEEKEKQVGDFTKKRKGEKEEDLYSLLPPCTWDGDASPPSLRQTIIIVPKSTFSHCGKHGTSLKSRLRTLCPIFNIKEDIIVILYWAQHFTVDLEHFGIHLGFITILPSGCSRRPSFQKGKQN